MGTFTHLFGVYPSIDPVITPADWQAMDPARLEAVMQRVQQMS